MDEPMVTIGLVMGLEVKDKYDTGAGDSGEGVLLVFCPGGESEGGKIDITTRMMDLALMGFAPVAITRWDPSDHANYVTLAKEGLSKVMQDAVLTEAGRLGREAVEALELWN
jgi:hypothetical protein